VAVAGAGSGLVTPPLASTTVRVAPPEDAGMASGVNSTFRQIGIAVSVAVLGGIFDARISGATTATLTARYASALNDVLLVAACVAFAACALALALIRGSDFHAAGRAVAEAGTPAASTSRP
jgi:predicted MFS family arabinose efflux permease